MVARPFDFVGSHERRPGVFENLLFVSYRRTDTAPHALAVKLELESQFRAAQVFVDTHHIQGGDRWPTEIELALNAAKVILPIIGQSWVGATPEGGRRIADPLVAKTIPIPWAELEKQVTDFLPSWSIEFSALDVDRCENLGNTCRVTSYSATLCPA